MELEGPGTDVSLVLVPGCEDSPVSLLDLEGKEAILLVAQPMANSD